MAIFNIAAGHGAGDPGATYGGRKEKDDNLRLALAVGNELTKRGHTVRQFRTNDSVNCSASACRTWLGQNKADFSIVFHRNAYKPNQATGCETWAFNADTLSVKVATAINNAIVSATGYANRGRKGNGAAWLNSSVRCCEPEVGFIDNDSDNAKFDKSFNAIVTNIANTLEQQFGKGNVTPDPTPTPISGEYIAVGTTTNYLNIRKAPVNGAVLTSMPTGSKCNIYSIDNGWAYLNYNGTKGYSSTDYMTIEYLKKEEPKVETPAAAPKKLYRVRDKWTGYTKQVGAYESLENAIKKAKATKLNVYDWNGKEVWNYAAWEKANAPKVEPTPVVKEEPKVEAPKVETPKTEEIKTETPKVEEPKVEVTEPQEPVIEQPKVEPSVETQPEDKGPEEVETTIPKVEIPQPEDIDDSIVQEPVSNTPQILNIVFEILKKIGSLIATLFKGGK